ncbi:uncharacterized protein BT62DRAFT_654313 [Guyanagaster necrorhizus]|uniref:Uncharacterized protein n=1 Tax=Guyanagaster necrorhizus TaxID=856835 RepID=A0A9P7VXX2_9AGAR|nr:uncharacterized protein BT62DRAFT_654313 [Guyanagaster necrorhizus MCA 3950]KAG7448952.1 hypothetical protein BT62DRAFT_654313 [Guyanagaster necrorhizus MCA 3950]
MRTFFPSPLLPNSSIGRSKVRRWARFHIIGWSSRPQLVSRISRPTGVSVRRLRPDCGRAGRLCVRCPDRQRIIFIHLLLLSWPTCKIGPPFSIAADNRYLHFLIWPFLSNGTLTVRPPCSYR